MSGCLLLCSLNCRRRELFTSGGNQHAVSGSSTHATQGLKIHHCVYLCHSVAHTTSCPLRLYDTRDKELIESFVDDVLELVELGPNRDALVRHCWLRCAWLVV